MSAFIRRTKNPVTGAFQDATWLDDFFGQHRYGVQFAGEAHVYEAWGRDWEFEDQFGEEVVQEALDNAPSSNGINTPLDNFSKAEP